MKKSEELKRISSCYVSKDCAQVTIPYKNNITIYSKDGIMYSHKVGDEIVTNSYLGDERKNLFPYSNIPTYRSKKGSVIMNYVNQLFDFDQSYVIVADGKIKHSFVIKNKQDVLLANKSLSLNDYKFCMCVCETRDGMEKMFAKPTEPNEKIYIMDLDGKFYDQKDAVLTEEEIVKWAKNEVLYQLEGHRKGTWDRLSYIDEFGMSSLKRCVNNMTIEDVPKVTLPNDKIIIKANGQDVWVFKCIINFVDPEFYEIDIFWQPMSRECSFKNITEFHRKKIPFKLNPEIKKETIQKAKTMEKILKR